MRLRISLRGRVGPSVCFRLFPQDENKAEINESHKKCNEVVASFGPHVPYISSNNFYQVCLDCPAGKECGRTNAEGTDCPPGHFSMGKLKRCSPCPSGYKCPDKASPPVICEKNTYRLEGFFG